MEDMIKEKQIEEIYEVLTRDCDTSCVECKFDRLDLCLPHRKAEALYNAGYRKQKEGVWIKDEESKFEHRYHCSVCNFYLIGEPTKHCEECGTKMKGGAE
jgi:hypothetical protein